MALPIILPAGGVLIYGPGLTQNPSGVQAYPVADFLYGYVYQVYDGGAVFVYGGDLVSFRKTDIQDKLLYNDWFYLLVDQAKLVTQQPLL